MKARTLALLALFAAMSAVFLWLASVFPTGQLGFIAVCSLWGVAAVIEAGAGGGAAVFAVTLILGLLLLPDKTPAAVYGVFFGWYPIMKLWAERPKSRVLQWIIKLICLNAALTALIFGFSIMFFGFEPGGPGVIAVYLIMNAVFVVFDLGVTQAIGFYMKRIVPHTRKGS